ncbi:retrovirus-related pol polyprotein from transposon TNT 1-94 [Tanacetum coccineum]|uniref:Retrovirus-related pol polyprotein from transposon TNT 1-94 n=1 Tax=Tanacetum coccineum TaxID=301880 RepID=A0ABQ5DNU3_9ASTR
MVKPVWNNAQRVNHQNFAKKTHPCAKKNMVPRAVLMKSGLVSINTARQVNFAHSKTLMNVARPMSYLSKTAHSTVKRPIHKNTTFKNSNINQRVNTIRGKKFNTARPKAVVNAVKGNNFNAVKALACWVWKPKYKVLDHGNLQMDLQDQGVIDSGCLRHMTGNMSYLTDYEEIDGGYVAFRGNPKGGKITRKGTIKTCNLDFENVYFVRKLKFNLFSVSQMYDKKNSVLFNDTECIVLSPNFKLIDERQVLLRVPRKNNMYSVDLKNIVPKGGLTCLFAKATSDESKLWHKRLGHLNFKTMNKLVKGNLVRGLPSKHFENDQTCVACQKRKQHRASCKSKTENSISLPLHLLHIYLFDPTFVKRLKKKMYCLVVTDDYSRFTWVFFLATKDETSGILKFFIIGIENLVDHKGILRQFSVARTPQQNVVAERRNMTLIEDARTMLADSKLPTTFWAEAVNTTCYVQNRVLVVKPYNETPYERFHGKTPTLSFMRPFRCPVTILNTIDHLGKFDGKADEGFFVGYSLNSKAFRVFNSRKKIVKENLHIRFSESTPNVVGSGPDWLFDIDALTRTMNYEPINVEPVKDYILLPLWTADPPFSQDPKSYHDDGSKPSSDDGKKVDEDPRKGSECNDQEKEDNVNSINNVNTVSSTINAAGINEVNDVGENISIELPFDLKMLSLEDDSIFNFSSNDEDDDVEADMNNLDTTIQVSPITTTRIHKDHPLDQVIGDLKLATITRKMSKNLEEHGFVGRTQKVDLPNRKRAIGSKWVFRNKKDEKGIVIRNKARLVAQGYTQEEGIDYDEVFAPVARIKAIRLFLAYALFKDFVVYQMDVKSDFLYGKIKEEVYVCQPPRFEDPNFPNRVNKVEKALYGLHQAPRAWYEALSTYLLDNGFQRGKIDKTLFIKRHKGDILLMSSMGELTFLLRLQVKQKKDGIFISQDKYVVEILKSEVKTASTPMETQKPLLKDEDGEEVDVHMYRSMIGSLMYLTSSRPDIMFAVCACARYQVNPKVSHLHAVKRIFRYLKGQPKLGIWYPKDSPFDLVAYTDSDYAGASLDRKSTTGGCQFLRCRLISWQCKKQTVVANSTTEAEYVATSSCCGQVLWIQNQLLDYGYALTVNPAIYVSCIEQFWSTAVAKTINGEVQLHVIVDSKTIIITESSVRRDLLLADEEGIDCFPNSTIFENLALMGFLQIFLDTQLAVQPTHKKKYIAPCHTKNIFGNIRRVGKGFYGRVTPLFPTMVVQTQSQLGEGLAIPTDPQHTPTILQSSTQPQKIQKPRKHTRKDTERSQSGAPTDIVADEAIHKELGDRLVRAATTASSLEAEQDSANITKTRSKATPNEPSSPGTNLGGGPRCQKTMGDTIAQTRFKNVSKHSNDSLLVRGNTLQSDEDSLKLKELMELCTNLQNKVLDLEQTKTTQQNEISSLKRRVKKLEQKKRSRTHGLKRLRKVGVTTRVESSDNEESLGEDASKQGRIDAMDADDNITLLSDHHVNVLDGEKVFGVEKEVDVEGVKDGVNVVEEVVEVITTAKLIIDVAQVSAARDKVSTASTATTVSAATTTTVDDITLAQALAKLKSTKPNVKGIVIQEPGEYTTTRSSQLSSQQSQDKGKGIWIEPVKPLKMKDQIRLDEETALKLQAEFDEEERLAREKAKKEQEANIALIDTCDDIQAKIDVDHQLAERIAEEKRSKPPTKAQQRKIMCNYLKNMKGYKLKYLKLKEFEVIQEMFDRAFKREKVEDDKEIAELKQLMGIDPDEEEVAIDAIQIMRADGKSWLYMVFSQMLKSFDREDLYKLVKAKYGSTRSVEGLDLLLWGDPKTMFEPHIDDEVWKKQHGYKVLTWKQYDSCGVHSLRLQSVQIHMLVEKKYPLTPSTLLVMLEKKLIIDYESKMAYQLLKSIIKHLKK